MDFPAADMLKVLVAELERLAKQRQVEHTANEIDRLITQGQLDKYLKGVDHEGQ